MGEVGGMCTYLIQDVGNAVFKNEIRLNNQDPIDKKPTASNGDGKGGAGFCLISCTVFQTGKIEDLILHNMA